MPNPSNLYAEKIFSEHPVALWSLDDDAGYISLISDLQRQSASWTATNCELAESEVIVGTPFPESASILASANQILEESGTFYLVSDDLANFKDLGPESSTISIGGYFNAQSPYILSIQIGYEYFDTLSGSLIQNVKSFDISVYDQWSYISETFNIPDQNTTFRIIVGGTYLKADSDHEYRLVLNGITVGQKSEEFQSTSLGSTPVSAPDDLTVDSAVSADLYGISVNPAFYVVEENTLLAKNTGIPMVYGSTNITNLSKSSSGKPSIIFPGYGFLNDSGKYKKLTFEAWVRIDSNATSKKRIFGPVYSNDGIYVDGPFISVKIGNKYSSYFIGEWYRPMLLDFRYSETKASLLINSEEIISIALDASDLNFPINSEEINKDWLGFYCYDDVESIDLDCVAIYSYIVPNIVAKRRWVYGQGVDFPENINTAYSGTSMYIDNAFANYGNTYSYPSIGKWNQAIVDNISILENTLSSPKYSLPEIIFNNKTFDQWKSDIQVAQSEQSGAIKLKPNSSWIDTDGFILFNSLSLVSGGIKAVFVKLKELTQSVEEEPILVLYDKLSKNYIRINIGPLGISYIVKYGDSVKTFHFTEKPPYGEEFYIGIDFRRMSEYFGGDIASILGRSQNLSMYVGGFSDFDKTFDGNIYEVGLLNERSFSKVSDAFSINGILGDFASISYFDAMDESNPLIDSGEYSRGFWDFVYSGGNPAAFSQTIISSNSASYLLHLENQFNYWSLGIGSYSYWEDYIPLSYFATYISDKRGDQYYDVDFIQLNIDYPSPSKYVKTESVVPGGWSYAQLYNQYQNPVQRSYESLDNELFTGYSDYEDLSQNSTSSYSFDTSNSMVRAYVTFQTITSGANAPASAFISTEPAPKNGVVIPGENWMTTKYEVVNNMIIYPPAGIDISNIAIVTHIEIVNPNIFVNPIRMKSLQYSSQSLSSSAYNPVGTRFGVPIYPYKRSGIYFDFKSQNPFSVYKESSPYLYLTRYSGIQPRGAYDPKVSRGLMTPINQNRSDNYKVIAMQLALRHDQDRFPYAPTQIFEIESKDTNIKIFMVANDSSGSRARLYAINAYTGQLEDGIAFYLNGRLVREPVISVKQWSMLGISFANVMDVSNYVGFFRITGPVLVNSLSYYQSTNLQEVQQVSRRPWFRVRQISASDQLPWEFWNSFYIWRGVLIVSSTSYYGVSPLDIYKAYTGTNKFIFDDNSSLSIGRYQYDVLKDVSWYSQISSAL